MSHQLVAFRCMVCIWTIVPTNGTNRMSTMFSKVMLLGRMQCRLSLHCMVILRPVKREEQLLLAFNLTSDHRCSLLRYIINLCHPIDGSGELTQRRRRRQRERQKSNRFIEQNNYFARASRFFVHFFAVVARLQRESASFHVLSGTETKDNNFLFFSWTLIQSLEFNSKKIFPAFDELNKME